MSVVSQDEIKQLAKLARLELSDSEMRALESELSTLLGSMAELQEVDTEGVLPMTHVVHQEKRLRPDEVKESLCVDEVLAAAPKTHQDCFEVPAILSKDSQ